MIGNTNFELQLRKCYPPPPLKNNSILLIRPVIILLKFYSIIILNSVKENFVEICVLSCYVSTYIKSFILPISLQDLKYVPSAPVQKSLPVPALVISTPNLLTLACWAYFNHLQLPWLIFLFNLNLTLLLLLINLALHYNLSKYFKILVLKMIYLPT